MHLPFQRYINVITYDDTLTMDMPADTWKKSTCIKKRSMQWTIWDRYVLVHIKRLITVLVEARQWLSYGIKIETLGNKAD